MKTIRTEGGSEIVLEDFEVAKLEKLLKAVNESGGTVTGKMIEGNLHIVPSPK